MQVLHIIFKPGFAGNRKMKILQINSVCGIRSTGRICTDIAEILADGGHECKIAYGRETVPEKYQKYAVRIGNELDVRIHAAMSRIFDMSGFGSRRATEKFIGWLEGYDPDIIHLHNLHGYYIDIQTLFEYLSKANKPVVWTLHDCWAFTGHCAYFTVANCDRWKTGCYDCPQKSEYPKSYLLDRAKQNWERKRKLFTGVAKMVLVTPSYWLAGLVNESFLGCYSVKVIHNGIDTGIFKPTPCNFRQRYSLAGNKVVLGVASAWSKRKGLADFIKLSDMLDDSFKVVLVGLTKKQIKKMPKNIVCIERTNSAKELAEIYTAADLFVNLSLEETMGLTTVEAMACGTPAIVYNSTANAETAKMAGGLAVECDLMSIKKAIEQHEMKIIDHCAVSRIYDKKVLFDDYINLYTYLI